LKSAALGHSTALKENYSEIKFVLEKNSYYEHNWIICVDLKKVGFPLGLQCGCTKFPCFLCLWDSRARAQHWIKQDWPVTEELVPGETNVQAHPLVERSFSPPLQKNHFTSPSYRVGYHETICKSTQQGW